jgi:hypothetical protein
MDFMSKKKYVMDVFEKKVLSHYDKTAEHLGFEVWCASAILSPFYGAAIGLYMPGGTEMIIFKYAGIGLGAGITLGYGLGKIVKNWYLHNIRVEYEKRHHGKHGYEDILQGKYRGMRGKLGDNALLSEYDDDIKLG